MKKVMKKITMMISSIICIGMALAQPMQIFATQKQQEKKEVADFSKENVQKFLDEYFSQAMDEYHVPGVAVSVVKEDIELLSVAYGVENIETKEPVSAEDTLFPAASVSKLFTATAIMQLYEQSKIDLNQDIRCYIPEINIKNAYDKPITCKDLLTHSSGLDEQSELSGSTLDKGVIESQQYYFSKHIPVAIRESGSVSNYSNMGYNLLGYIVERVSGQTYEEYVEEHILNALSMGNSSVRIPEMKYAKGYIFNGKEMKEQPLSYQYTSGSSGIIATAKDMEHFMMMHLNDGTYGEKSILQEQTQNIMFEKQFTNADVFDGMGFGWVRTHFGDTRVYKHEGALPGYATTMLLIPEEKIGIYVATNSLSGICFDFEQAFMRNFYGIYAIEGWCENKEKVAYTKEEMRNYLGTYRSYDGIAQTNLMRIAILFDTTDMEISLDHDEIKLSVYNQKKEREETALFYCGNGTFLRQDGKGYVVVEQKANGEIYAYTQVSHSTYEKAKWYENKNILVTLWIIIPLCFIINIVVLRKKTERKSYICITLGTVSSLISTLLIIMLALVMISSYDYHCMKLLYVFAMLNMVGIVLMFMGDCLIIYECIQMKYNITRKVLVGIACFTHIIWGVLLCYFQLIGVHFL